jgi:hypothetical protein
VKTAEDPGPKLAVVVKEDGWGLVGNVVVGVAVKDVESAVVAAPRTFDFFSMYMKPSRSVLFQTQNQGNDPGATVVLWSSSAV